MIRIMAGLALLALSACSNTGRCATAQALAIGLDVGGSWTAEQHYRDANAVCEG